MLLNPARREIKEELGIEVELTDVTEILERVTRDAEDRIQYHYVVIDYLARHVSGEPTPSPEALEVRWIAPEEFPQYEITRGTAEVVLRVMDAGRRAGVI